MKEKIIITIFIGLLLFCLIPCDTVKGAYFNYVGTFTSGIIGNQYSDSYLTTIDYYSPTGSNNVSFVTGDKGYEVVSNSQSIFEFDYSSGMQLNIFQIFHSHIATCEYSDTITFYFYNSTHSTYPGNQPIIVMYGNPSTMEFGFYNDTGSPISIDGMSWGRFNASVIDSYFGFTISDYESGLAMYYCEEATTDYESRSAVEGFVRNPSYLQLGYRIDRFAIEVSLGSSTYLHNVFDNLWYYCIGVEIDEGWIPPETGCGADLSSYKKLNMIATDFDNMDSEIIIPTESYRLSQTMGINHYLEARFLSRLSTRVYGISLLISYDQYHNSPNLNNYELYFSGRSLGIPDCINEYGNSYTWMLLWDFSNINVTLNDEKPTFAFKSDSSWDIAFYRPFLNNGWSNAKAHNSEALFKNGQEGTDGTIIYVGLGFISLPITMYYGNVLIIPEINEYEDSIYTIADSFYQYDNINIGFTINSTASEGEKTYIKIWKTMVELNIPNQLIPYEIPEGIFSGQKSFTAWSDGIYVLKLERNGDNVSGKTIVVMPKTDDDYLLTSYPNPYDKGQSYTVGYRYFNSQGKDGLINIFRENTNPLNNDYTDFTKATVLNRVIDSNTSGNITIPYMYGYGSNNLIVLYIHSSNSTYYEKDRLWEYYLPLFNLPNEIFVGGDNPHLILKGEKQSRINIYGTHNFFGFDVYITLNNKRIYPSKYATLENNFALWYNISKVATYNVSLLIDVGGTVTLLDYKEFTVEYDTSDGTGTNNFVFGIAIEPPYSYFAGIFIVIISTLSPLLILGIIKKDGSFDLSSIPQFLYLIMAIVGFVISILLGFFPSWSVVVLIILGALIITIMYLRGNASVG